MRGVGRVISLVVLVLLLQAVRATAAGEVRVLTIDGAINPHTVSYLDRGLREARTAQNAVVVLRLNTPGGLETSMRKMSEAMLASPVPVVVYARRGQHRTRLSCCVSTRRAGLKPRCAK